MARATPIPTVDEVDARRALDRFLADNRELEELAAQLSAFNVLHVLRVEQQEIRHSNVLAWLLDPGANHGWSDTFLRRLLSRILLRNDESGLVELELSAATVELATLTDAEVLREYKNIDILVASRVNKWALLIENKVRARESPGQLTKYLRSTQKEFRDWITIPVFLTLGGDEPSDSGYVVLSYEEILDVLTQLYEQHHERLATEVAIFVRHYLMTLRGMTMSDPSLGELCKAIYSKHRKAIELIMEYGASSQTGGQIEEHLRSEPVELLDQGVRRTWFMPRDWLKYMKQWGPGWNQAVPYSIVCWYSHRPDREKIGLGIEVGPTDPPKERQRLISALVKAGFKANKLAFREEAKYTRIYSDWRKVKDFEDTSEVNDLIAAMWKKAQPKVEKVTETLQRLSKSGSREL